MINEDYFSSDEDEGIIFASSPFTVKGMAAKETVFAVLLRRYSGLLLERETWNIFADPDEGASLTAEQYERIINSDEVFSVKYETVKGEYPSGKKKSKADLTENFPVHGIIALMILVFSLFSESENRFGKYRSFGRAFTAGERMVIFAEKRLASLTIPALAGVIAVRMMEAGTSFFMDLLLMLAFILYTTFWCSLFSSFFKREEAYICWSLLIFALSFLVTPVLWNIGEYLPLAAKLSCLLPNGAYMYLLELWS